MKFLIDAHLPKSLANWLVSKGFDAIHTLDLPEKNLTTDVEIIRFSMENERIVVSKDSDFWEYFILNGQPHKLLLITTGNIINKELIQLFDNNLAQLVIFLTENKVVEISKDNIIVHF
ncbi:MAG: DUF5615 family PIN-like protein [Bacteroidia bacterium]|nr:DUF5615 family PIN-like protein [Bacteroidia bacterium]